MTDQALNRRDVARALLADRGDLLVISGLGGTSWDVTDAGDSDLTFPLWGGMGLAATVGLGLAVARPDHPVLVVTGDGEMLMGIGSLATIGVERPPNLTIAVLDNGRYGETGQQATHTALGVDLCGMARAAGIRETRRLATMTEVEALAARTRTREGTLFAQIAITAAPEPLALPPRDGAYLKARFRNALLGQARG